MKSLPNSSRILIGLGSLSVIATYFLPLWQIQLWAPQYPEGLNMKIWHNKLSGAFDIINGLNHYIGMREIKEEMFPEFGYLGILIGIFIGVGLLVAILGKLRWLWFFAILSYTYGILALYDFYQWGYDYGHNLDPHAAIVVPGMSYQPPVVGYKNLLNFTAYSGPDAGGWIIIGVGMLATFLLLAQWLRNRKLNLKISVATSTKSAVIASLVLFLFGCSSGPQPIRFGRDGCESCKMTLTDHRFGAEIVTTKGKVFKFDDVNCLISFIEDRKIEEADIAGIYVVDFLNPENFIDVNTASFLHHEEIRSPMRSDVACFVNHEKRDSVHSLLSGGQVVSWEELKKIY